MHLFPGFSKFISNIVHNLLLLTVIFWFYLEFRGKTKAKSPTDSDKAFLMLGLISSYEVPFKAFKRPVVSGAEPSEKPLYLKHTLNSVIPTGTKPSEVIKALSR